MPGPVQSIERAAAVLRLLARGPGRLGVVEVASSLGLAKGTVHGILRTLHDVGFVDQDRATGKYQLGAALQHLEAPHLDVHELRSRSVNWADSLAARCGQEVRLGVLRGGQVLIVHHVFRPDGSSQRLDVGSTLPQHASALGKAVLAFDPSAVAALRDTDLVPYTHRTISGRPELLAELQRVRAAGFAVDLGEYAADTACVAAPVRGPGGLVVAAMGASGPVDRMCDARGRPRPALVRQVTDAARAVGRELTSSRW